MRIRARRQRSPGRKRLFLEVPKWLTALLGGIFLLYPIFVYWSIQRFEPRFIGVFILLLYALRLAIKTKHLVARLCLGICFVVCALLMWLLNDELLLLLLPAIINLIMAGIFTYFFLVPPTIPARFAEKAKGTLASRDIVYTNVLTVIWIVFFLLNGAAAAITALYASREIWALYNGLIAYFLIGALFLGDYLYRHLIFDRRAHE